MNALLFLFFSVPAYAAPPCWTIDGSPIGPNKDGVKIADGQFLLTVEVSRISKENLVLVMQKSKFGNVKPSEFPTVMDDMILFPLEAVTENTERAPLMEAVNGQIDEMLAIPGVRDVACNSATGAPL